MVVEYKSLPAGLDTAFASLSASFGDTARATRSDIGYGNPVVRARVMRADGAIHEYRNE